MAAEMLVCGVVALWHYAKVRSVLAMVGTALTMVLKPARRFLVAMIQSVSCHTVFARRWCKAASPTAMAGRHGSCGRDRRATPLSRPSGCGWVRPSDCALRSRLSPRLAGRKLPRLCSDLSGRIGRRSSCIDLVGGCPGKEFRSSRSKIGQDVNGQVEVRAGGQLIVPPLA